MSKTLAELHEDVPPDYYDAGIKKNFFQRLWHKNRFKNLKQFTSIPSGKVLDIGCHSGLFTHEILNQNPTIDIYGIDISKKAIAFAKKRIRTGHFYQADAHTLPFNDNYFDGVFCLEMLEHVENPKQVIHEMKRVLKRKGFGIILIPTDSILFELIWSLWNTYSHVWNHTHIQKFSGKSLIKLLNDAGLEVVKYKKTHLNMLFMVEFKK